MRITSIGPVIAWRELELDGKRTVRVEFGKPKKVRGHPDYYCAFRILGLGHPGIRHACGVDPVQAIQLAFELAGITLLSSGEARSGRLTWLGVRRDFGLPGPRPPRRRKT